MQDFKKYLNPFYKEIAKVENFSHIEPKDETEAQEYPYLEKVTLVNTKSVRYLLPRLQKLTEELEEQIRVIEQETGDDAKDARGIYNKIMKEIQNTVDRINLDLSKVDSPYFGKIIFEPKQSRTKKDLNVYIGRFAVVEKESHLPLVVDWRAPIANLYYKNSGPKDNIEFESPTGKREGNLKQKRQFEISRARIQKIYDAKSGNEAADAFLLSQLKGRVGKKLTDIVSTIQSQQNEIIREAINKPVIIQGVAGSGKTTILLHRLAYLFFNFDSKIVPEKSLIMAPNKMFLDYISDVLPNLGVRGVNTLTYLFWAKKVLDWGPNFTISTEDEDLKIKEFKGSLKFLRRLDDYFDEFEEEIIESIPYSRVDIIRDRYYELKKQFPEISMEERVKLSVEYAFARKQFQTRKTGSYDDSHKIQSHKKKEILDYLKRELDPYRIYKQIFKENRFDKQICKYTLQGTRSHNSHKYFRIEDLAPMVYFQLKMKGTKEFEQDYIVVDEAQDLSFIEIATLVSIAKNGNITLAGDLAQSIIPPFYIRDWQKVRQLILSITDKKSSYHQLNRCYRTTIEIIDYANKVFKKRFPETYKLPEAVLRHGDEVRELVFKKEIKDLDEKELNTFLNYLKEEFNKEAVTCALICRDKRHAKSVYLKIKDFEDKIGRDIVEYQESDYKNGVLVLPISHAKGLEFDSIILADVNEYNYPDDEYSVRLLYVGITRALHRVLIVKNSNIPDSPLLKT